VITNPHERGHSPRWAAEPEKNIKKEHSKLLNFIQIHYDNFIISYNDHQSTYLLTPWSKGTP
jgi:hypothetical protein